jgi:lysophospholipase L1-like esterase
VNHSKFDYVVDYAGATANKTSPNQYQDQYAFTNYIHPNDLGHQAMADAWDLGVFKKFSNGVSGYC